MALLPEGEITSAGLSPRGEYHNQKQRANAKNSVFSHYLARLSSHICSQRCGGILSCNLGFVTIFLRKKYTRLIFSIFICDSLLKTGVFLHRSVNGQGFLPACGRNGVESHTNQCTPDLASASFFNFYSEKFPFTYLDSLFLNQSKSAVPDRKFLFRQFSLHLGSTIFSLPKWRCQPARQSSHRLL